MRMKPSPTIQLLLAVLAGLSGCSGKSSDQANPEEPFGFSEVRELALPIASITPQTKGEIAAQLRRDTPQITKLYLDALTRFDGIYGDGVGPAKRKPDFLGCKTIFHTVAGHINAMTPGIDDGDLASLWSDLKECRTIAQRWSGPAEIATFGNDLKAMTDGSMLVLSYAATASESDLGPKLYGELDALEGNRRVQN